MGHYRSTTGKLKSCLNFINFIFPFCYSMWYEILPSLGILYVCLIVPPYASKGMNWLFNNGKYHARYWEADRRDFNLYLRDRRLTGSEYVPRGLEGIPGNK